ncbi:MAG: endopeptidase La [Myxococcota bacterium]
MQNATPATDWPRQLPVLPLRDYVVFPHTIVPLCVAGAAADDPRLAEGQRILVVAQRDPSKPVSGLEDVYSLGTLAVVVRDERTATGTPQRLLRGLAPAHIQAPAVGDGGLFALVEYPAPVDLGEWSPEVETLKRSLRSRIEELVPLLGLPTEILDAVVQVNDPDRLSYAIAANLGLGVADAQAVLETVDPVTRLRRVETWVKRALDRTTFEAEAVVARPKSKKREERDTDLRDQLRAIREELEEEDGAADEIAEYRRRIDEVAPSQACREESQRQLLRLEKMHSESPEAQVVRNYLDWVVDLPWSKVSEDRHDLANARKILDADHAHLESIKNRLLEFLGVRKLRGDSRGPILCFFGPPGVGKTSLGRSIARSMEREFVRISLGGVRDEAEIRGHRRTYVGAMPGRILQALKQAGTKNPVILLDEIDKMGSDLRGDPSAALLEVLDPEQNASFSDHFLNTPFDLSEVLFIATANVLETIPAPLRDRMELIRLSGYAAEEKLEIAKRFLAPRQREEHGLVEGQLEWSDSALARVVADYTREAGVRGLERQLAVACRKIALRAAEGDPSPAHITCRNLERYLGAPLYLSEDVSTESEVGVAHGLAWTEAGGELLCLEASVAAGSGLVLTGHLGDIMKESGQTALGFARSYLRQVAPGNTVLDENEVHFHVPAGAIPKDGPSAGIAIAAAAISVATNIALRGDVAMTGEITLRGRVLPVGGVREKALAALRSGIYTVIVPEANLRDLDDIPREQKRKLKFVPVARMDQVLDAALCEPLPTTLDSPVRPGKKPAAAIPLSAKRD